MPSKEINATNGGHQCKSDICVGIGLFVIVHSEKSVCYNWILVMNVYFTGQMSQLRPAIHDLEKSENVLCESKLT